MAVLSGVVDRLVIRDRRRNVRNFRRGQPREQAVELFVTDGRCWKSKRGERRLHKVHFGHGLSMNEEADIANGEVKPLQRYVIIEEDVDFIELSLRCFRQKVKRESKCGPCFCPTAATTALAQ